MNRRIFIVDSVLKLADRNTNITTNNMFNKLEENVWQDEKLENITIKLETEKNGILD